MGKCVFINFCSILNIPKFTDTGNQKNINQNYIKIKSRIRQAVKIVLKCLTINRKENQEWFKKSNVNINKSNVTVLKNQEDLNKTFNSSPSSASTTITSLFDSEDLRQDSSYYERNLSSNLSYEYPYFSWMEMKNHISLCIPSTLFKIDNVPFDEWDLQIIPTLGASHLQRSQKLFTAKIISQYNQRNVFIKKIPLRIWKSQYNSMNQFNGEYVTDGENFVMEAAVLSFLTKYNIDIAPRLIGIVKEKDMNSENNIGTHICLICELYGEDLVQHFLTRDQSSENLDLTEKRTIQFQLLHLLKSLHSFGITHLDLTPENVLIGNEGLKLCDFSKSTLTQSSCFRHCQNVDSLIPFESCEPTVGKAAYMPPECWKIYKLLEDLRMGNPLFDLEGVDTPEYRAPFYFEVIPVDVFMLGVLFFWIWSEGSIWRYSDVYKDQQFSSLVKNDMNIDIFYECQDWPLKLRDLLKMLLDYEPKNRITLDQVFENVWWYSLI